MTTGASRFTYVQVAESLKEYIASEHLEPGDRLPPIRTLADKFDVSPTTVGNALTHLRELGVIRSNSTRGYFVASTTGAAETHPQDRSLAEELDVVRGELRRLTERVDQLEGAIRGDASLEPSANH